MRKFILPSSLLLAFGLWATACTGPANSFCGAIKKVDSSTVFDKLDPTVSPNVIKKDFDKVASQLTVMKKEAPANMSKDVNAFAKSFGELQDVLAGIDYDALKISKSSSLTKQVKDLQADMDPYAKKIDTYYNSNC